jgi:NAD(P) transhydrogenase subunit alpha
VALIPETAGKLIKAGHSVVVQSGAGLSSSHTDDAYRAAGAEIAPDFAATCANAAVVLKIEAPSDAELGALRDGAVLIAYGVTRDAARLEALAKRGLSVFALEKIPRTTRAQRMDVLSSMASLAGYRAVLLGAGALGKIFPLMMTAAGTIAPSKVFVIGAGVAGLQAIATARRLGAVVEAFDIRPAVKEEVQSLGATFVQTEMLDASAVDAGGYAKAQSSDQEAKTRALLAKHVAAADIVISTAAVPGRKAPRLIEASAVSAMRPGSVIVDLAAESGGNCELTRPGETVIAHGVSILGPVNVAASLPVHASQMYSRNLHALLQLMISKEGALKLDFADDILDATCVAHGGALRTPGAPGAVPVAVASGAANAGSPS